MKLHGSHQRTICCCVIIIIYVASQSAKMFPTTEHFCSSQSASSRPLPAVELPEKKHSMRDVRIARVTRLVVKPVVLYEPELAPLQVTGTQGRARGAGKDKASNHCLYHILPPQRPLHDALRVRGHQFQLPNCIYKFHKQSFIVSSLSRFLK